MKIDIVIPNFNGANLIEKNVPVIFDVVEKYKIGKIIIVDDYSDINDYKRLEAFVEKYKNKIVLYRNQKNMGFSSSSNKGVSLSDADLVVLLNSDVIPSKNFLDQAIDDIEKNEMMFGVGFMDESVEGSNKVRRGRGLASWSRGFLIHRRGEVNRKDTFWISGGSSIIRRDMFIKLGGFDSLYNPFYWEDIDLSYRARKAGFVIEFNPDCVVEHRHEEGAIKKHYSSFRVKTISFRNQFIFVWKNINNFGLIMAHIIWLPYHFVKALLRLDLAFFWGFGLAVLKLPIIMERRSRQSKLYKLGDRDLLR